MRRLALGSIALAAIVGGCARRSRVPTPTAPPAVVAAPATVRPDSAARDSATRAPVTAAPRDSAARADSARQAPARSRRRNADDPTARCREVNFNESPATSHLQSISDAQGKFITFIGGGVVARCRGIRNRLQADSAEYYEMTGQLLLIGNVVYDEPSRVRLTSNRLTYFTADERLLADGNVVVILPTATTMTGPNAEYFREAPALRDRARLNASGRPVLRVVSARESDSTRAAGAAPPTATKDTATIIANVIVDEADSAVFASGQVQIIRPDVIASADSAMFDQGTEIAHLVRSAEIRGQRGRAFTLSGALIDLFSRQRDLTRVVSRGAARVVSEDLDLKSDTVDLRIRDSRVERAFAWGPSRATATSPERDVVADSIEAVMPAQRIRELHAVRRAVARSVPDSTRIVSKERDLLAGDTIVARFDTLAATADTTKNPPVRQIVAAGNASSVFQIASSEGRTAPPGINYVRGRRITVAFDSGRVQTVTVIDSASGLYLEPADSAEDSTAARRPRPNTPAQRGRSIGLPSRRPPDDDSYTYAPNADAVAAVERSRRTALRASR